VGGKIEASMRVAQQIGGVEMNVNEAQHCWYSTLLTNNSASLKYSIR
jgi:hypothetical protein